MRALVLTASIFVPAGAPSVARADASSDWKTTDEHLRSTSFIGQGLDRIVFAGNMEKDSAYRGEK